MRGEDDASEDVKSHNVSQICFGSGDEEEEEDLHSVKELEATSPTDSKDRSGFPRDRVETRHLFM